MELLSRVGIRLSKPLGDADLRYILWRSYNRLKDGPGIMDKASFSAKDAEMRDRMNDGKDVLFRDSDGNDSAKDLYEKSFDLRYKWTEAYQDS